MSLRANGEDLLSVQDVTLSLGTGDWTALIWFQPKGSLTHWHSIIIIAEEEAVAGGVDNIIAETRVTPGETVVWTTPWGNSGITSFATFVDTWYGHVVGRSGTDLIYRIFAETGSTPLHTETLDVTGDNFNTLEWILCGIWSAAGGGEDADGEVENFKMVEGNYWSDAECRTELDNYGIQTAGGTEFLDCTLIDLATGLTDQSARGNDLTNQGFVNGASTPSPLTVPIFYIPMRSRR